MIQEKKGKTGSSFDGFLAEEGILETCEEQALKQILADQQAGTGSSVRPQ
jgi:hypothetical protein